MLYSNIVSDNGLVLTRWQAIIWTSDGLRYQRIYASLGRNELKIGCQGSSSPSNDHQVGMPYYSS